MLKVPLAAIPRDGTPMDRRWEALKPGDLELSPAFVGTVEVLAEFSRREKEVLVRGSAQAAAELECSRCLKHFQGPIRAKFVVEFAPRGALGRERSDGESGPDFTLYEGDDLPLGEEVRQELELEIPSQPLCRPDCKGLCPVCGTNRNDRDCGHRPAASNPALAKLGELLKKEEKEGK